jgi:hypothetical protein
MADTTETCKVDLKAENWWTDKRTSAKGKWRFPFSIMADTLSFLSLLV